MLEVVEDESVIEAVDVWRSGSGFNQFASIV
jgi:hypothetical protein